MGLGNRKARGGLLELVVKGFPRLHTYQLALVTWASKNLSNLQA